MSAAAVEDEDTKTAFQTWFAADTALSAAIPGGITDGAIVAGTAKPWCKIACAQGPKPNEYIAPVRSGQGYHDFRKVTLTVTGVKAAVVAAVGLLRGRFDWQPKGDEAAGMTVPNTRKLVHVMPLPGSPRIEQDKARVAGDPQWNGILEYQVHTVRTIP